MQKKIALSEPIDVRRMFVFLSCHLFDMAKTAEDVEKALSIVLDENVSIGSERMQTLQKLDYLRQALEDSSALIDVLSSGVEVTREALNKKVKLGVTQALYSEDVSDADVESGSLDFF